MVTLGCFSSLSNGGAGLLGVSLGGMNLTFAGLDQTPSMVGRGVPVVYLAQMT
jgi:hypothetical protein